MEEDKKGFLDLTWTEREKHVNELYQRYLGFGREEKKNLSKDDQGKLSDMEAVIIDLLQKMSTKRVQKTLLLVKDRVEDAIGEAIVAILDILDRDRRSGTITPDFARQAYKIFYYKACDEIRKCKRKELREISIYRELPGTDIPIIETVSQNRKEDIIIIEDDMMQMERDEAIRRLLGLYYDEIFSGRFEPKNSLALLYARVLPHARQDIFQGQKKESDSRLGLAFSLMKGKSFEELSHESVRLLSEVFYGKNTWAEKHWEKLEKTAPRANTETLLKDIVYTAYYEDKRGVHYSQDEIGNYAEGAHETAFVNTMRNAMEDPFLRMICVEYAENGDDFFRGIIKRRDRLEERRNPDPKKKGVKKE